MLGWMMIFALVSATGGALAFATDPGAQSLSARLTAVLFGVLFLIGVLARTIRGRV
jgi:uncharacterized membrane protein YtjA (UPF0391 family)